LKLWKTKTIGSSSWWKVARRKRENRTLIGMGRTLLSQGGGLSKWFALKGKAPLYLDKKKKSAEKWDRKEGQGQGGSDLELQQTEKKAVSIPSKLVEKADLVTFILDGCVKRGERKEIQVHRGGNTVSNLVTRRKRYCFRAEHRTKKETRRSKMGNKPETIACYPAVGKYEKSKKYRVKPR